MKFKSISIVFFAVALTGCASTWSSSNVDNASSTSTEVALAPTDENEVIITDKDITDRKYEVLGDISVNVNKTTVFNANPTEEMVNEKLKEKAATLGANAVVLVRYGKGGVSLFSWGSLQGKGRAIRFID